MAEALLLHVRHKLALIEMVELDRAQPRAQQAARVVGADVAADGPAASVALAQQSTDHPHDARRVRPFATLLAGTLAGERTGGQRDRRVGPLGGTALHAASEHVAAAHVLEKVARCARGRGFAECPPDVNAGVIVAAADADPLARGDVCGCGPVELASARAIADLPDTEQLGQTTAMTRGQRGRDRVVRMSKRAHDLLFVHVARAQLDVAAVRLQPLVVLARDPVAEHVHSLWLAAKVSRQLLGDEDVRPIGDLEHPSDRVVVGDRHQIHAAALGQLVDLLRRVAHSGSPSARCTPSFDSCEAVEWQCMSTLQGARGACRSPALTSRGVVP